MANLKKTKIGFQDQLSLNAGQKYCMLQGEHSAILSTFNKLLIDFSLTVKAATLIFIPGLGLAISSTKQGKSGSIYNFVKNK